MKNEDVKIGQYCWAKSGSDTRLVVVKKDSENEYYFCGWEVPEPADKLEIISVIEKPGNRVKH